MYSANVTEMRYTALATGNYNVFSKVHILKDLFYVICVLLTICICTYILVHAGAVGGQKRASLPWNCHLQSV